MLQIGSTSAQSRNWWWSSPILKVERSLKDGSLILSVTKLQKKMGKYGLNYFYFNCFFTTSIVMSSNCSELIS